MVNNKNDRIDNYIALIRTANFSKVPCDLVPIFNEDQIKEILVDLFINHLRGKSPKHPLIRKAIDCGSPSASEIPLMPLSHLKFLGSLLSFIKYNNESIYEHFIKRLVNYRSYDETLFELYIGCLLKNNDPEIEFYEINSGQDGVPDFRKKLNENSNIWIEVYRRNPKKSSERFWGTDIEIQQHSQEEIDDIVKSFIISTCSKIAKKRKKDIDNNDCFVTVSRISDGYLAGFINYQSLKKYLLPLSTLVIYKGGPYFYGGDYSTKEFREICFHEHLCKDVVNYLNNLFSFV